MKTNSNDINEYRGIILAAFDHAMDTMLCEENKAEAAELTRRYFGEDVGIENSPVFCLMNGFMFGVSEGMRIMAVLNGEEDPDEYCRLED